MANRNVYCSFCRKSYRDVGPLVEGPGDVYICGECIELCQEIVKQEKRRRGRAQAQPRPVLTAQDLQAKLCRYVSGQPEAVHALAAAADRHLGRQNAGGREQSETDGGGRHVLLVGPARSSMVFLTRALAHVLDVPFAHGQADALGETIPASPGGEHPAWKLLRANDFDIEAAQHGVVYLDGVDRPDTHLPLLKLLCGAPFRLVSDLRVESLNIQVETRDMLFVCGGRFDGLDRIIERGGRHMEQGIMGEDLRTFGLTPELVRFFPFVSRVKPLDEEILVRLASAADFDDLPDDRA